jgi:hypothetical protein
VRDVRLNTRMGRTVCYLIPVFIPRPNGLDGTQSVRVFPARVRNLAARCLRLTTPEKAMLPSCHLLLSRQSPGFYPYFWGDP